MNVRRFVQLRLVIVPVLIHAVIGLPVFTHVCLPSGLSFVFEAVTPSCPLDEAGGCCRTTEKPTCGSEYQNEWTLAPADCCQSSEVTIQIDDPFTAPEHSKFDPFYCRALTDAPRLPLGDLSGQGNNLHLSPGIAAPWTELDEVFRM